MLLVQLFFLYFFLNPLPALAYKLSDHYNGKVFFNPGVEVVNSFWDVIRWKMTSTPVEWPEKVKNKNYPFRPLGAGEKASFTFINHSTLLIQLPKTNILTDPVFSERVSPVTFAGPKRIREPGLSIEQLPHIDVVIISHNHYDHLDIESLKTLDKKFHPLFLVPVGDEKLLKSEGILHVKSMDWWDEIRIKDTRYVFTPCQHWSARSLFDTNESLWGSFQIDNGVTKIYFSGDTGYGKHFIETKNRLGSPDIALLPIGAYKPRWFMKLHHMNPEEAVKAHIDLGATRTIGIHYGTFQLTDEGLDEPVRDLKLALDNMKRDQKEFIILDEGQAFSY